MSSAISLYLLAFFSFRYISLLIHFFIAFELSFLWLSEGVTPSVGNLDELPAEKNIYFP